MIRLYFQQALYHLRENPIITWVSVLGTALAICMIMVLVITFQVRLIDCEPEVNRADRYMCLPCLSRIRARAIMIRPMPVCQCVQGESASRTLLRLRR